MKSSSLHQVVVLGSFVIFTGCLASCSGELDDEVASLASSIPVAPSARAPNTHPTTVRPLPQGSGGASANGNALLATQGGSGGEPRIAEAGAQ
ncbi:MAG: hypothetical protein RJA70_2795 [Pseudomonadota bacterium]|jgi:hypothetical protein